MNKDTQWQVADKARNLEWCVYTLGIEFVNPPFPLAFLCIYCTFMLLGKLGDECSINSVNISKLLVERSEG